MSGGTPKSKLWGLAWRVCEEISAKLDVNPYDFMAALLLEAAFKDELLIAWVLYGYFGVELSRAFEVAGKVKEMLQGGLASITG